MPETRKYRREVTDELDQAILTALGEPVRPFAAGEVPHATPHPSDADVTAPALGIAAPGAVLGTFSFQSTTHDPAAIREPHQDADPA